MSITINTDLTLQALSQIFDNDKFYIKLFKNLLNAVITDDFTNISKTPKKIKDLFEEVKYGSETKIGVETFVNNEIYEKVFSNSTLYEGLISSLIDIYSVIYTIIRLRRDITDISIQPDEIVDAYLDSFGFKCKELFNYIQKREIVKTIYTFLRRKGTPELLIDFLNTLGFNYFFISEFELCKSNEEDNNESLYDSNYKVCSRLIYEEKPENDLIGFFNENNYNYSDVREADPLLIKSENDLDKDSLISYPAQTAYYQIGVTTTYPDFEYRVSAFNYAVTKKLRNDIENGIDIFELTLDNYSRKVSYIGLVQAFTYILGEYFGNVDITGLKYFGWNKDITDKELIDIMKDIENEIKRLFSLLSWNPDEEVSFNYSNSDDQLSLPTKNTIKSRKDSNLKEIEEIFYTVEPLYSSYEELKESFRNHDPNLKEYIDNNILLSEEERIRLFEKDDLGVLEKNFDLVLDTINNILETLEYYIFDNTSFMIPLKNLMLSYSNIMEIVNKLDKHYSPIQAKMIFPQIIWMIRDLPGDIVALEDNYLRKDQIYSFKDIVFRSNNYKVFDQDYPEPYTTIFDWKNKDDNNPHLPVSLKYLNDPIYYLEDMEKNIKLNTLFINAIGYDWRNLSNYPLMVRGEIYEPYIDFDTDYIDSEIEFKMKDSIRYIKPSSWWIEEYNRYVEELESKKAYCYQEYVDITGNDKDKRFKITHIFKTKNLFIEVYDLDTGETVYPLIETNTVNYFTVFFNKAPSKDKHYRILILAPMSKSAAIEESENIKHVSGQVFKLIDNGYLKNYMCVINNIHTKNFFTSVHHSIYGDEIGYKIKRVNDDLIYIGINKANIREENNVYNFSLISFIDDNNKDLSAPKDILFQSFIFKDIQNNFIIINHNFRTSNLIIRVYDMDSNLEVKPSIVRMDSDNIELNFSSTVGSGSYRILILGVIERFYKIALPMNNLIGYSNSFRLKDDINNIQSSFSMNHNLNSLDTFEQIIEKNTGEVVHVHFDRVDENNMNINMNEDYVKDQDNFNKEFIFNIFSSLSLEDVKVPSTIYNTNFESFLINYNQNDSTRKNYTIIHNFNNDKVVVQVYDEHNRKVYPLIRIKDSNQVVLKIGKPLKKEEHLKVNILSLPDSSIQLTNYNDINKKSNHYIDFYDYVISRKELFDKNELVFFDGGDSLIESENTYDSGNAFTEDIDEFKGGKANTNIENITTDEDGYITFSINHNLSTEAVIVNIFNERTKETIDAHIAINNSNNISVGIEHCDEITDDIHVVVIGALRSHVNIDYNKEIFDKDCVDLISPFHYSEYKKYLNHNHTEHDLRFDMNYYDDEVRMDDTIIKENLDIIHEIKDSNNNITTLISSEYDGFNCNDIRTNDPIWVTKLLLTI